MQFHAVAMSDQGLVRRNNEDNFYFDGRIRERDELSGTAFERMGVTDRSALFVVCDGMGGEALGEEASRIGVAGLNQIEQRLSQDEDADFERLMYRYLQSANDEICEEMRRNKGLRMGTTFAALWLHEETAQTINLGDSRVYLIRRGVSYQLTRDHTHAQRLVDIGIINREEAEQHPERHRLMQHLGLFPEERALKPSISARFWLENHDRLLLCSDGVTDMIGTDKLTALIEKYPNIDEAGRTLMKKVLANGGKDNITFILIAVDSVSEEARQGIRETTGVLAEPPKWPINTELDGDTKELPAMPVRMVLEPVAASPNTSTDRENVDESQKSDPVTPRDQSNQKRSTFEQPAVDYSKKTETIHVTEKDQGASSPVSMTDEQSDRMVSVTKKERDTLSPSAHRSETADTQAEKGVKMRRTNYPETPGVRSPQTDVNPYPERRQTSSDHQIRAPRPVQESGLTEADLERFRRAREQARIRQYAEGQAEVDQHDSFISASRDGGGAPDENAPGRSAGMMEIGTRDSNVRSG
ncbi:MAG TPA: serine/threonine-protein phosphatase, partial [Clostridiaceae bacterium]|nr:serine/threonine-protein phosphatase [Clostridiaceae bacterium]